MSNKSGLINVLHAMWANVLILIVGLLTGIITARVLGAAGRGEMAAIIYWPQLLSYVLTLGLPSALIYNMKSRPEEAESLISVAIWSGFILGGIAVGIDSCLVKSIQS